MNKQVLTVILLTGICFCWTLRVSADEAATAEPDRDEAYKKMEALTEAMLTIKKYYVEEKTYEELIDGALRGMLSSLDEHSGYLSKEAFDEMKEDTDASFEGIGVRLELKDGVLTVVTPMEGTPAFRAGLQSGDRIVEIDGKKVSDMKGSEPFESLRGPKGEKVIIRVEGEEEEEPHKVVIVRDDISVPTVKGAKMMADGVGYIRITKFSRPTAKAVEKALHKLKGQKMESLIIDLRDNPGGLLTSAVDVCQKFVNHGDVIVRIMGRENEKEVIKAGRGNPYRKLKLAVLVNEGSASASEIVAGALQDLGRAILVGAHTYGKASVQSLIPMDKEEGAGLRLTTAHYCTPKGRTINHTGLQPDVQVEVSNKLWHRIRMKRMHDENSGFGPDIDWREYDDLSDIALERAVALLQKQDQEKTDDSQKSGRRNKDGGGNQESTPNNQHPASNNQEQ